jgi:hypothetical protein
LRLRNELLLTYSAVKIKQDSAEGIGCLIIMALRNFRLLPE